MKKVDEKNLKDNSGFKNDTFMLAKQKAMEKVGIFLEERIVFNGYVNLLSSLVQTFGCLGVRITHSNLYSLHLGPRS